MFGWELRRLIWSVLRRYFWGQKNPPKHQQEHTQTSQQEKPRNDEQNKQETIGTNEQVNQRNKNNEQTHNKGPTNQEINLMMLPQSHTDTICASQFGSSYAFGYICILGHIDCSFCFSEFDGLCVSICAYVNCSFDARHLVAKCSQISILRDVRTRRRD